MLVATAGLALTMGWCRMAWLSTQYRLAAEHCARLEYWCRSAQQFARSDASRPQELALILGFGPLVEDKVVRAAADRGMRQTIDYCSSQREKYERAAARPWSGPEADASESAQ
jgi:hypothetical protein